MYQYQVAAAVGETQPRRNMEPYETEVIKTRMCCVRGTDSAADGWKQPCSGPAARSDAHASIHHARLIRRW